MLLEVSHNHVVDFLVDFLNYENRQEISNIGYFYTYA